MPRARTWKSRDVVKLMHYNGYHTDRCSGSHVIYTNAKGNTISVPKSNNKMLIRRLIAEHGLQDCF